MDNLWAFSLPLGLVALGLFYWLAGVGEARRAEAEAAADNAAARLLEAKNADRLRKIEETKP